MQSTQLGGIANLALVAPVKPGFIPGADTVTYARRLEVLLKALMAIRAGSRESALHPAPFPDTVGRLGILQSFRYAVIPPRVGSLGEPPPEDGLEAGVYRLYLNVVFDGGWEPYMRVIYRDLGYLLDTIFCNCVGYRISTQHTYDDYVRWVRAHEVPAGILYTESSGSVLDQRYLEEAQRAWRSEPDPARARRAVAGLALPPPPVDPKAAVPLLEQAAPEVRQEVVGNHLRALKGLFDLRALYPDNADRDEDRLRRFARRALPEFCAYLEKHRDDPPLKPHEEHVKWVLEGLADEQPTAGAAAKFDPADIQPGIHGREEGVTHGCLLLMRVTDATKARAWIDALPGQTALRQERAGGGLFWNIAFTANGLRALGQREVDLDAFPQEFLEGMEARAGLLGDVRGNHPEHWRRPRLQGTTVAVDLASVHLVVQYRLAARTAVDAQLHPLLAELAQAVEPVHHGLRVLCVEPMRRYPARGGVSTEHFGFQDGFSQPVPRVPPPPPPQQQPPPAARGFDDTVNLGEIYLGHPGDRDPGRFPDTPSAVMDNGSFLVVRKIRQEVARWQAMLERAALREDPLHLGRPAAERAAARARIASMLMGRQHDGAPVVDPALGAGNDFNYDADPAGSRCPFQSHVRRANPRIDAKGERTRKMPRLLRRGMSYGPRAEADPAADRGLFFMAYCGSIAEQFEILQRWLAGGNSSGIHSAQSDPMLGVPQKGTRRSFQWLGADGRVADVDLGDEPFTALEWGLYLFAPSLTGLRALARGEPAAGTAAAAPGHRAAVPPAPALRCPLKSEPYQPTGPAFERRKLLLQGRRDDKDEFWRQVNACGGQLETAYGRLESRKQPVLDILAGRSGLSVCGYGRRFEETVGRGFLGLDDPEHGQLAVASGIKKAIAAIDEPTAFAAACRVAEKVIDRFAAGVPPGQPINLDLVRLSESVVLGLYKAWFGLPDGVHMQQGFSSDAVANDNEVARCPRDFVFVARHNFGAHPSPTERHRGTTRGRAIQRAVRSYLAHTSAEALVGLTRVIHQALSHRPDGQDEVAWTVGGVMLGFGPSVHQHCVLALRDWVEPSRPGGPTLWDLQVALLAEGAAGALHAGAAQALRGPLAAQMRREPVPGVIWREVRRTDPPPDATEPEKIVLGLHGLMHDPDAEALMFGGELDPASPLFGVHACPGHGMAMGVLLGVLATLLRAGTLRRTPSPAILMLDR